MASLNEYILRTKTLPPKSLRTWVKSSSFVFQGKVKALGECNLEGVEPNERMAMVKIDNVVIAPRSLGDLTGETVTVYLQSPNGIREDQQVTFFAAPWHYGNNLGLIEVGRTDLTAGEVQQSTIDERLRQLDEQLEERVRSAEIIVSGSVISTQPSELTEGLPGMEEGVEWNQAQIRIETIEKGDAPADLRILFPKGGDREFGPVPKYNVGQKGVWLLRSVAESDEGQEQQSRLTEKEEKLIAHDPLDFHAISALPRIQALLWRLNE
jgi:hypothetical protein